jgi:hypothetical protein
LGFSGRLIGGRLSGGGRLIGGGLSGNNVRI